MLGCCMTISLADEQVTSASGGDAAVAQADVVADGQGAIDIVDQVGVAETDYEATLIEPMPSEAVSADAAAPVEPVGIEPAPIDPVVVEPAPSEEVLDNPTAIEPEPAVVIGPEPAISVEPDPDAGTPAAAPEAPEAAAAPESAPEAPVAPDAPLEPAGDVPEQPEEADVALEAGGWPSVTSPDGFHFVGNNADGSEWLLTSYTGDETTVYVPGGYAGGSVVGLSGQYVFPASAKTVYLPKTMTSFGTGASDHHLFASMLPGSTIVVQNEAQYAYLTSIKEGAKGFYMYGGHAYDPTGTYTPVVKMAYEMTGEGDAWAYLSKWGFVDITDPAAWYVPWVAYVCQEGLMTGYSGSVPKFGPNDPITRGQVCTILFRYFNPDSLATTDKNHYATYSVFDDVAPGMYYTAAINWCYAEGIVTGYKDENGNATTFGPNDNVTREQLAAMMGRFAGPNFISDDLVEQVKSKPQGDLISNWAIYDMAWAYSLGIISGYEPSGELDPQGFATRAQMAKIITLTTQEYEGILSE